jgi:hypothetical protein
MFDDILGKAVLDITESIRNPHKWAINGYFPLDDNNQCY